MPISTRQSYIASEIGPTLPLSIVAEILKTRATHVIFHANKLHSLEIQSHPQYHCKSKDEEAIRNGRVLDQLLDLDLSSNCLGKDYHLMPRFSTKPKASFLDIAIRLRKLNLASNGLTEQSFLSLIENDKRSPQLPHLETLDVSYNSISKLPHNLHVLCPSLRHLIATNNKLKSLTTLLVILHSYRGKLENVHLMNRGKGVGGETNNPLCSSMLYREKVVFVLGSTLAHLDCVKITNEERERVRIKLEHGLLQQQEDCCDTTHRINQCEYERADKENRVPVHRNKHKGTAESQVQTIGHLERQVASLSDIVAKQAQIADSLLGTVVNSESNQCQRSDAPTSKKDVKSTEDSSSIIKSDTKCYLNSCVSPTDNIAFHQGVLKMAVLVEKGRNHRVVARLAFFRWSSFIQCKRQLQRMKQQHNESEKKWRCKAKELMTKAVSEVIEKSNAKLELAETAYQMAESKALQLTSAVKDLEERLCLEQNDRNTLEEESKKMSTCLKAASQKKIEELKEETRRMNAEMEAGRLEMSSLKDELNKERSARKRIESVHRMASQGAHEAAAVQAAELQGVKMKIVQHEATIRQLKSAFEQTATRAASDRSKCEEAVLNERQAKDLLRKQTQRLHEVEAELEHVVGVKEKIETSLANRKSKQSAIEKECEKKSSMLLLLESEVNKMNSVIAHQNSQISAFESQVKRLSVERDGISKQVHESNKAKSRLEDKNNRLQTQLNQVHDDIRSLKQKTVDTDRFNAEVSRGLELHRSLEEVRESSKRQEEELRANGERMNKERNVHREKCAKQEKRILSLESKYQTAKNDWKTKQSQIMNEHSLDIERVRAASEQKLMSLTKNYETESE